MNPDSLLNIIPPKYHGLALFLLAVSPYLTRALHSVMHGGGIRGMLSAIWFGTNTPAKSEPPLADPK